MKIITKYGDNVCQVEIDHDGKDNGFEKQDITEFVAFLETSAGSDKFSVLLLIGIENLIHTDSNPQEINSDQKEVGGVPSEDEHLIARLLDVLDTYPKLVMVKIEKGAHGIPLGLVACCDIVISPPDATFSFKDAQNGHLLAITAPYVIRKTGLGVSRDMMISGRRINGEEAYKMNLVNILFPQSLIAAKTRELAHKFSRNCPSVMMQAKSVIISHYK